MLRGSERMLAVNTYGSGFNVFRARVVSALFVLFSLGFFAFCIYAFVSGKIPLYNSHGLTPAGIEGLFIIALLVCHLYGLKKISKTVQKAELDNHRLKITTILGETDLPVESIKGLRDGSRIEHYVLETSNGEYLIDFKSRDKAFAGALRAEAARRLIR
jgi:hypothetical protein